MKRLFLLYFTLMSGMAWGQSTLENRALQHMERLQFAEAYPLWDHLARRAEKRGGEPEHYADQACAAAQRAGMLPEALRWSQVLLARGDAPWDAVVRHLALMRASGKGGQIQRLLDSPPLRHLPPDSLDILRGIEAELQGQSPDTLKLLVERYRPRATAHEYAATTYKGGVVFQTTPPDARATAVEDAWAGMPYTELAYLPNAAFPHPMRGGRADLAGAQLFPHFGHSQAHDGPVNFDATTRRAVLTTNQQAGAVRRLRLDCYTYRDLQWEPESAFPWNSADYSCAHGAFDGEGSLVFASDMPGGLGGMDLYISRWQDSTWAAPENLGPSVNTAGNEVFPYVNRAGDLYFSSDGHLGSGGLDVFQRSASGAVTRLGVPVNSYADDFAFYFEPEGQTGWLSSNRSGGVDAIFRVKEKPAEVECSVQVVSCSGEPLADVPVRVVHKGRDPMELELKTNNFGEASFMGWPREKYVFEVTAYPGNKRLPVDSLVLAKPAGALTLTMPYSSVDNALTVVDEQGRSLPGVLLTFTRADGSTATQVTSESGQFVWSTADPENELVSVLASLINFNDALAHAPQAAAGCQFEWRDTLVMMPVDAQIDRIDLASIMYESGAFGLSEESKLELDKLVGYLVERPNIRVELSSHTDCRDDEQRNLALSQSRADECVRYIISKGIDESRILAIGYGETKLLNHCSDATTCGCAPPEIPDCVPCSEELHQENRRTELRLLAE